MLILRALQYARRAVRTPITGVLDNAQACAIIWDGCRGSLAALDRSSGSETASGCNSNSRQGELTQMQSFNNHPKLSITVGIV